MQKTAPVRWQLRDYVFAAFMSIGCIVTAALTVPLAAAVPLPGVRTIVWAPLAGIFLTLGMARLRRIGTVALILGIQALVSSRISLVITAFVAVAIAVTELVMLTRGDYGTRTNRLLGNVLFFGTSVPAGAIIGGYAIGGPFAAWLSQPWILVPMTLLGAAAGAVGWWLGEQVVSQLQRAGKLDVGT